MTTWVACRTVGMPGPVTVTVMAPAGPGAAPGCGTRVNGVKIAPCSTSTVQVMIWPVMPHLLPWSGQVGRALPLRTDRSMRTLTFLTTGYGARAFKVIWYFPGVSSRTGESARGM